MPAYKQDNAHNTYHDRDQELTDQARLEKHERGECDPKRCDYCTTSEKPERKTLKCGKCSWTWTPRSPDRMPAECPACKSRYWQKQKGQ